MKKDLHDIACKIFFFCTENHVSLEVEWISRDQNFVADFYSKLFDFDDWSISDVIFQFFSQKWGPYDIDLFADSKHHKVNKFFSKFWTPGTIGVDWFAFNWKLYNSWIVPPVHLISDTIKHLELCKAHGTLVIPKWTSAQFWSLLVNPDGSFKTVVTDYVEYYKPNNFLKQVHASKVFLLEINFCPTFLL
jgi:hypothetical protein